MSEKHTPGPWTTDHQDHDAPHQDIKIKAGNHHTICTVWIDDAPVRDFNAMQEANARLMAAAPELLEALKGMIQLDEEHHQRGHGDIDICKEVQDAYTAIAKATGQDAQA